MRRVIFYSGGFAQLGGIETFARNLLCYLQGKGNACELVCWGRKSPLLDELLEAGIKIWRSPWRWGCRFRLPDCVLLPMGLFAIRHRDTVIFGKHPPYAILKMLRIAAGERVAFTFVTPYRPELPSDLDKRSTELRRHNLYDTIVVQSELFASDLRSLGYSGTLLVIPYMPEPVVAAECLPEGALRIGFLGRLVGDKRVHLLLEAFRALLTDNRGEIIPEKAQLALDIYGEGSLRSELEAVTRSLDIGSQVTFHGGIPQREVRRAIQSCHFFVFTSRVEGQCLAALEILSCGRPIVATRAGAFGDILADSRLGILAESDSSDEIAMCMKAMINRINNEAHTPDTVQSAFLERYGTDEIGDLYLDGLKIMEKPA